MSTDPRKASDAQQQPPEIGEVMACPSCLQEMAVPADEQCLPLHMSRGAMCDGSYAPGAPPKFGTAIRDPLTIPDVSSLSISEILSANTCLSCGGPKTAGQPICKTDHGVLPPALQMALPDFMRGYLFADEHKKVAGHYDKTTFMEVFKSALVTLAEMRKPATLGGSRCP